MRKTCQDKASLSLARFKLWASGIQSRNTVYYAVTVDDQHQEKMSGLK